ncbi:MAG: phage tail tape measure protein [Bacteroidales bacterium]|nr:phage tail tape measure protein [Bacteroidales bacterium]
MANNDVKASVSITFSGQEAQKQIEKLTNKAEDLRKKLEEAKKALNPDQAQIKKIENQIKDVEKTINSATQETKKYEDVLKNLSGSTIKQLRQAQRQLNAEIQKLKPNTEEYVNATKNYATITQRLKSLEKGYKSVGLEISNVKEENDSFVGKVANGFQKYFALLTSGVAVLTGVSASFRKSSEAAAKLDDTYSDVMKTTGLLKEQVAELDAELLKIDTRTSREQLLNLARDAGKLGISGKEEILGFVRAADQIQVALGEDLGEGAIKNLGKIADVLGYTKSMGIEDALLSIGSAINAVGQASTASESYMVDFVQRLAGVGAQTGISAANLIGFASGLDQSAMKVEMAATAFQNFIMKLYEDPAKFAEYANMEVQQFTDLLNNDANNAVITILETLNQKDGFASLVPMFQDMGLDGARAVSVLAAMATNISAVTDAQSLANTEFEKGTSVQTEYETKNNNLQAELEKARKEFQNSAIALGQSLNPIMLKSTNLLTYLIKLFASHGKALATAAITVGVLTLAWNANLIKMKLVATWNTALRMGTIALAGAKALLAGNLGKVRQAWHLLNATMKLSIIGAITAGVTALVMAVSNWVKKSREAKQATDELAEIDKKATDKFKDEESQVRALTAILYDNRIAIDKRKEALAKLKEIVPGYHADLTEEGRLINENKTALDQYVESLRTRARIEVFEEEIAALEKQKVEYERAIEDAQKKADEVKSKHGGNETVVQYGMYGAASTVLTKYGKAMQEVRKIEAEYNSVKEEQTKILEHFAKTTQHAAQSASGNGGGGEPPKTSYEDASKNLEKQQQEELNALKQSLIDKEITETEYTEKINKITLSHLEQKVNLARQYGQDETAVLAAFLDEQVRRIQAANRETEKLQEEQRKKDEKERKDKEAEEQKEREKQLADEQKHLEDLKRLAERFKRELLSPVDLYNEEKAKLDELKQQNLITEEEYQKLLLELKKKYAAQSVSNIDSNNELGIWEKYQLEKEALQQFFEEGEMGWEEYEKSVKDLRLKYTQQTIESISSTLNTVGNLVSSLRDMEMAQAEEQYQADLAAAGDNAEAREKVQEQYEQKKLDIQKKYANADMAINIAKAIAAGALAAVQAFAQLGPIAGAVFAGVIAATTAAEVATIVAQRNAIMNTTVSGGSGGGSNNTPSGSRVPTPDGFSDGGFTPTDDDDNTPVGIVHANEWVAPSWMIKKNPVLFANLEKYRVIGRVPENNPSPGFSSGGYTSPASSAQMPNFDNIAQSIDRLNKTMDKIDKEGIQSYMVYNQFRDFQNQRERFKKMTSK